MLSVINGEDIGQKSWDEFVENDPAGSIEQTWAWADFQDKITGRKFLFRFGVCDGDFKTKKGNLVGVVQVFSHETGFGGSKWAYSPRGPLGSSPEAIKRIKKEVMTRLERENVIFWRADPAWDKAKYETMNFRGKKETTSFHPTDRLVLNLQLSEEEMLKQMKRKGRYNIKLATKKGVEIKATSGQNVTSDQIETYMALQNETTARDGFSGHDASFFHSLFKTLKEKSYLFESFLDGKVICAAVLTIEPPRAVYYYGVSSSDPKTRPAMAPYALQWEMIKLAKEKQCQTYDFTGISPLKKSPNEKHVFDGITQFKEKFGGERLTTAPGIEIPINKAKYALYKLAKLARKAVRSVR